MNNIFNFNRFGKYFLYDLNNARNRFGLSMIICGITPIIAFVLSIFLSMLFKSDILDTISPMKATAIVISIVVVVMAMPVKVYGSLTDKRAGSTWLLIPASTFEKFLSAVLVVCVVAPVCLCAMLFVSDSLLGLIFPGLYGLPFISSGLGDFKEVSSQLAENGFHINLAGASYLSWCENILIFTLGAVFFKKSKTAKTILAYFIIMCVISSLATWAFGGFNLDNYLKTVEDMDVNGVVNSLNIIINVLYFIIFTLLLGGLYYRLRTIKH